MSRSEERAMSGRSLERLRDVLVATSLDDACEDVVRTAAAIAEAAGARLHLVHVAEMEALGGLQLEAGPVEAREVVTAERHGVLERQVRFLDLPPELVGSISVESGPAHRGIIAVAERLAVDLMVVGATRHGRTGARLLGSTADRVIRRARCPVLVVRGQMTVPPVRILAPVDLSVFSADALRCGVRLIDQLGGEDGSTLATLFVLGPEETGPARVEDLEDRACEELERFTDGCGAEGTAATDRRLRFGAVVEEIVNEAEGWPAHLVVMGTHGHGALDRLLVGSVALGVAGGAPCSVLLIPPDRVLGAALAEDVMAQTTPVFERKPVMAGVGDDQDEW